MALPAGIVSESHPTIFLRFIHGKFIPAKEFFVTFLVFQKSKFVVTHISLLKRDIICSLINKEKAPSFDPPKAGRQAQDDRGFYYFFNSSIIFGTTSNRSPTIP